MNNINYNILQNINYNFKGDQISLGGIHEGLGKISNDNDYKEFLPKILNIYDKINKDEIDLIYNIPKNENEIKIFGQIFVKTNKDLCKIIYKNKEYDLKEKFDCKDIKENILKIKLKGINNVTELNSMFEGCSQLSNLSNFSNIDTTFVTVMGSLFKDCKFPKLPDITYLNTSNALRMDSMFEGCSSLTSLPDISNWNTSNVIDMVYMFKGCSSLKSIPDISKWDANLALKNKDSDYYGIKGMFDGCSESLNIPENFKI